MKRRQEGEEQQTEQSGEEREQKVVGHSPKALRGGQEGAEKQVGLPQQAHSVGGIDEETTLRQPAGAGGERDVAMVEFAGEEQHGGEAHQSGEGG